MSKFFKTTIISAVVTAVMLATEAFAGVMTQTQIPEPCQEPEYFNGFYVGLGGGLVKPNAKMEYNYVANITDITDGQEPVINISKVFKSNDSGKFGATGTIFAGFGKVFDSKYLGIEIFGNLYDPDLKDISKLDITVFLPFELTIDLDTIFKNKIKNDYSYGAFIRGGYLIAPKTMFYVLFGIDQSRFEVKSSVTFNGFDDLISGLDDFLATTNKFHKTKIGYSPGIGIETALDDQFSLRLQYIYTFYSSFKHTVQGKEGDDLIITKAYTTKVDPSRGMISLMLSRYFG